MTRIVWCVCGTGLAVFGSGEAIEAALRDFWQVHQGKGHRWESEITYERGEEWQKQRAQADKL